MKHFFQVFENLVSAIVLKVTEMLCICNRCRLCITIERAALLFFSTGSKLCAGSNENFCDGSGNVKKDNGDDGGSDSKGVSSSRCTIV